MRICVISRNTFTGDDLIVGEEYEAVPVENGTGQQNRLFHKLLQLYYASGEHSYNAKNMAHFKKLIKYHLGEGKEKYYKLFDDNGDLLDEPKLSWRMKSWRDYTKKQRQNCISNVISEMLQIGINDKLFFEILEQMEQNNIIKLSRFNSGNSFFDSMRAAG